MQHGESGSPQVHGQGEPTGFRSIQPDNFFAPVFEFATPVGGAYPPGYDPSYWNEGMRASFRVRSQIRVLLQSARNYAIMLPGQVGVDCRLVCFYFLGWSADSKSHRLPMTVDRGGGDEHWSLLAGTGEAAVCRRFRGPVVDCGSDGDSITEE